MSQTGSDRPIDPGAEFSRPREGKLPFIIGFVERHPACSLAGGEADLLVKEIRRLEAQYNKINTPELFNFWAAVQNEALHQRERWAVTGNDAGKTDADWFWLIGYLAGKALHNPPREDMTAEDLRLHRVITVAAAAANWHAALLGVYPDMRPGIAEPTA